MEKSLETGLEQYIQTIPGMHEIDPKLCSPLVLAYVGDCVFDLIVKTLIVGRGNRPVHKLHEETSRYVQASAQSYMMRTMQEHLNEEEHGVYRRGRNARSVSPAKISLLQITGEQPDLKRWWDISIYRRNISA